MKPILLYTGLHTGTHFAKMLLQFHPRIGWCVMDNDFVDVARTPGYTLESPGLAGKRKRCPGDGETSFGRLVFAWMNGELSTQGLIAYYQHWYSALKIDDQQAMARRRGREVQRSLADFGQRPGKALEVRPLLHEHMRACHVGCEFGQLRDVDVVVTLRHPMLTVISVRRWAEDTIDTLYGFWHCLEHVYDLPGLHWLPIDRPVNHEEFQRRLGLPVNPMWLEAAKVNPRINATTPDKAQGRRECLDPELLKAKRMLEEEGEIHPLLAPYWRHFRRLRCARLYEQFYNFR